MIAVSAALAASPSVLAQPRMRRVFVGTYTFGSDPIPQGFASRDASSRGIYSFRFDPVAGAAGPIELAAETPYPGNLIVHPDGRHLYAGSGRGVLHEGQHTLTAYAIEGAGLRALNTVPCGGITPTHGAIDRSGRTLLTTNFTTSNVVSFALNSDGSLGRRSALVGHGPEMVAPEQAPGDGALDPAGGWNRPHDVVLSRDERFAIVAEIATNRCVVYRFDAGSGSLTLYGAAPAAAGAGPRHLAFAPDYRHLYTSDEHGSSISVWDWDEATGALNVVQTVTTLPAGFSAPNTTAHVALHPRGRFVYVSNRGHGSLAGFRIEPVSGRLTPIGWTDLATPTSWCFDFDPDGQFALVANQSGNNVVVLRVDPDSGLLRPTGQSLYVPFPTCIRIVA